MADSTLWHSLETWAGLRASLWIWRYKFQDWPPFEHFKRRYLLFTEDKAEVLPCPNKCIYCCPRQIINHGPDNIEAWCREEEQEPFQLAEKDIYFYTIKTVAFHKELRKVFGLAGTVEEIETYPNTWQLGTFNPLAGYSFPVYLSIQEKEEKLTGFVKELCIIHDGSFVVISPTRQRLTADSQQFLGGAKGLFLSLKEEVSFTAKGSLVTTRSRDEYFAPLLGLLPATKSGGAVFFPTPTNTTWELITIKIVDPERISIQAGEQSGVYNYTQMGMVDKRSGKPKRQWELLRIFAKGHGVLDWSSTYANDSWAKQKEQLAKTLCSFFRLSGEPIPWLETNKEYRCRFRILWIDDDDYLS